MAQEDPDDAPPRMDYHDPTAGIGGSPAAASALTLRVWLAGGGLVASLAGIVLTVALGGPVALSVVLAVVAVTAIADLVVIAKRRGQGER